MSGFIEYDRELFIFGEPIHVPDIGAIRFLTYKEYLLNMSDLGMMRLNVLHIYYEYRKQIKKSDEQALMALEELKEESLLNIVRSNRQFLDAYTRILLLVLDIDEENYADVIGLIFDREDLFTSVRQLVLEMQILNEDEISPNPEIQKGIEMSKKLKSEGGEKQTPTDMISSVTAGTANSFKDVCAMTVLQIYSVYYRLGAMKSYDTTTLFATVSSDAKIEPWNKNIDLWDTQSSTINKADFDKKYGSLMK